MSDFSTGIAVTGILAALVFLVAHFGWWYEAGLVVGGLVIGVAGVWLFFQLAIQNIVGRWGGWR